MVKPTAEQIHRQLDRIVTSDGFANADRMSGFLRYVVERTLAGEADHVKEYAIGVEVFGRDESFDPRLDSIVRVEARRLRTKVDEYYAGPGSADDVVIQLRRGSYVPGFELRQTTAASASEPASPSPVMAAPVQRRRFWRLGLGLALAGLVIASLAARRGGLWATADTPAPEISIAVLPFAEYSSDPQDKLLAERLTDGVTARLARVGTIGVVSHTSVLKYTETPRKSAREIGKALDADVVLEASLNRSGDRIDVSVRLVNPATERKIWVQDFTGTTQNPEDLERQIATAVVPVALARALGR